MFKRLLFVLLTAVVLTAGPVVTRAQQPKLSHEALLPAAEAARLLPGQVFFRGQSATTQTRNSAGVEFTDGMYALFTLVDNSGYSSGIQQRYQAYLLTEVPLQFGEQKLPPGAYGIGMVGERFVVMDIGAREVFTVPTRHDADIKRPSPLQIDADAGPGRYRLYFGRNYVTFWHAQ